MSKTSRIGKTKARSVAATAKQKPRRPQPRRAETAEEATARLKKGVEDKPAAAEDPPEWHIFFYH